MSFSNYRSEHHTPKVRPYKYTTDTPNNSKMGAMTSEIFTNPHFQIFILIVVVAVIIRSFFKRQDNVMTEEVNLERELPLMEKRDFTLAEMAKYNGIDDPRILLGINGNVYDVTKGKGFYGPGGHMVCLLVVMQVDVLLRFQQIQKLLRMKTMTYQILIQCRWNPC